MKLFKTSLLLCFLFYFNITLMAQKRIDIEVFSSFSNSKLHTYKVYNEGIGYYNKFSNGFGLRSNIFFSNKIYFATGIQFSTIQSGMARENINYSPSGTFITSEEYILRMKTIAFPIKLGYYFFEKKFLKTGFEFGVHNNIVEQEEMIVAEFISLPLGILDPVLKDFFIFLNVGVDLNLRINNQFDIHLRPSFSKQINTMTKHLSSYYLDFGFSYRLY